MCSFSLYRYHLHDVVVGKIYFHVVRLKIVRMEIQLRRNEITGSGTKFFSNVLYSSHFCFAFFVVLYFQNV